jgi:hypothetical protein
MSVALSQRLRDLRHRLAATENLQTIADIRGRDAVRRAQRPPGGFRDAGRLLRWEAAAHSVEERCIRLHAQHVGAKALDRPAPFDTCPMTHGARPQTKNLMISITTIRGPAANEKSMISVRILLPFS